MGLSLLYKRKPTKEDWSHAPFQKPPIFKITFTKFIVFGYNFLLTDIRYQILETKQGVRVWQHTSTTLFFKPVVTLKKEPKKIQTRTFEELEGKETYKCPGCEYVVLESDENCPDCGLYLAG